MYTLRLLTDSREHDGGLNVASGGLTNVDDTRISVNMDEVRCVTVWTHHDVTQSSLIL